jgi:ribosomal protein S18 acetylase RimI-like enzyme
MIEYVSLKGFSQPSALVDVWNKAFQGIFPLDEKLLIQNTLENQDVIEEGSKVALVEGKVVGYVCSKVWKSNYPIKNYQSAGFINCLVVDPLFQKQGIGSQLLKYAEDGLKHFGVTTIHLGRDTYNYFPGLPFDFIEVKGWFEKRGYINNRHTHDLVTHVKEPVKLNSLNDEKYQFKISTSADKEALLEFFERCFPGRWTYECMEYYATGGDGREFMIVKDDQKVIGFCRLNDESSNTIAYNTNWRKRFTKLGGVGPLGVDREYRGLNLGYQLTALAINELINRNVTDIIIDWTSLIAFYRKFGFEVWKVYYYMSKNIAIDMV